MSLYNLTNYQSSVSIADLFLATNGITQAWFSILIFMLVFIIYFFIFKSYDTKAVLFAGSFTCSILATLFFLAGFITLSVVVVCVLAMVFTIIYFLWRGDTE